MLIDVAVGTFGSEDWEKKNAALCEQMSTLNSVNRVISVHSTSLAKARNSAARMSNADYIIFLDADDFLDDSYVEVMTRAASKAERPTIFKPMTRGFYESGDSDPEAIFIPNRDMFTSNSCVIGSMVSRLDFLSVGGFKEYPILEDWELFLNLICNADCKIRPVRNAVYCINVRSGSRNTDQSLHGKIYSDIVNQYRDFSKFVKDIYLEEI